MLKLVAALSSTFKLYITMINNKNIFRSVSKSVAKFLDTSAKLLSEYSLI